jgi:beta-lactamase class A
MLDILGRQQFTEGIPAGLPPGTRVEHKTGWIGSVVYHDAAIVRPAGRAPYVLVVLTGGVQDESAAYGIVRDISREVYRAVRAR